MPAPLHVTEDTFGQEVIGSANPVVVDFFATWCGPCKMLAPVIEDLARQYDGQVKFCKVDTDESPGLASRYGIQGVPTLMFFRQGNPVGQHVGYAAKPQIQKQIESVLTRV